MSDQLFTTHGYVRPTRIGSAGRARNLICAMPGCTNPRRNVQAAKYCDEHATSIGYELQANPNIPAVCYICDAPCQSRLATSIRLCQPHQYLRPVVEQWRRHHVDQDTARAWLADPRCHICGDDLAWRYRPGYAKRDSSRIHIDHDHRCCPGERSCGQCIRGLSHDHCNRELGHVEALVRRVGAARAHAIIDRLA
jgi:hypothetical protein